MLQLETNSVTTPGVIQQFITFHTYIVKKE